MPLPTVSVIIPCYNDGALIQQAVDSVREQQGRFKLDRIIIVDDRSTDTATLKALEALKGEEKIQVLANRAAKGPAGARNTGIAVTQADWIAFLDADDLLTTDSIEYRIEALVQHPDVVWCGGDFVRIAADDRAEAQPVFRSGAKASPAFDNYAFDRPLRIPQPVEYFLQTLLTWTGAALIRTDILKTLKGYREDLFQSEDTNLFIRIARQHDFLFVPQVVLEKREQAGGLTQTRRTPRYWKIKNYRLLLKDQDFRPQHDLIRKRLKGFYRRSYQYHFQRHAYLTGAVDFFWHIFFKLRQHLSS